MLPEKRYRVVRDPLWNSIRLDPVAVRIVDTSAFQRLRYIRQLGFAHLVYPGATHTRFDHALGVYHLTATALRLLREQGGVPDEVWDGEDLIPYAALLHDIGHYAFSHALEELEPDRLPGDHEEISHRFFQSEELADALESVGADSAKRIYGLIQGTEMIPLRGLVSGSLDLDKMEYLRRDARFCGVPYGEVDVDRLLQGLMLLPDPETGLHEVGVSEKAVAALESLLFAKYQMFRNVYWHHGVRAATALYKRIIEEAVIAGIISSEELVGPTDEELLHDIGRRAGEIIGIHHPGTAHTAGEGAGPDLQDIDDALAGSEGAVFERRKSPRGTTGPSEDALRRSVATRLATRWLTALRNRRLPKRAVELTAPDLDGVELADWVALDSPQRRRVEDALAEELELEPGEVFIDYPLKQTMFQLDVLVMRRNGQINRLGPGGIKGVIDLPRVAEELYATSRVLRVFTFQRRELSTERVLELVTVGG